MSYIVLDLEWNQAMSSRAAIYNYLPIHLSGEIIQIGAVKLDDRCCPAEEYQSYVKPVYFRNLHFKVKKITGIEKKLLVNQSTFPAVFEEFRSWCGEDAVFITWGCDDRRIMEQNIILHDLDWDWISDWINLQLIYNLQTDGDKNQKSLSAAMEHFGIPQTRTAHDALGDAYNTALVCSRLDLSRGLEEYENARDLLFTRLPDPINSAVEIRVIEHKAFSGYTARSEAFSDNEVTECFCPDCGAVLTLNSWVNQGDRRYMSIGTCGHHGRFLIRIKFRKMEDSRWAVNRIMYRADEEMEKFYRDKALQSRRRRRGRSRKK